MNELLNKESICWWLEYHDAYMIHDCITDTIIEENLLAIVIMRLCD